MSKEKKYRFYYSKKQDSVDEDMWGFTPRYTFVKTPNGYKQYSELCSIKGSKCNWSDAELVYETDDNPEIITHEAIPELIADLEAKLAESERESNARYSAWQEEISECDRLRLVLAEKDAEVQSWKDGTMVIKLGKLEEQLAEKDKESGAGD